MLMALTVFGEGKTEFELPSSKRMVKVLPAKMGQLEGAMMFFNRVVSELSQSELATLLDLVINKQKALLLSGKDPRSIDLRELATSEELMGAAFGNVSIISLLMAGCFRHLPGFAAVFSDIPEAEYKELEFDDGVMVILAIFILNYSFFTQRLLPMLMGWFRSLASVRQKERDAAKKKLTQKR